MRALFLRLIVPLALLAGLLIGYQALHRGRRAPLVVYCAHDSIYSEKILREFERRTGIPLAIRFDTEATKSLGLVELLLREKSSPVCDVFWNNELLGTLRLQEAGMLDAYRGPGFERIPAEFKDPGGQWAGFAARLRVWIVNTDRLPASEEAVRKRLAGDDLSRVAIAKPIYGTTLTHYAVLWRRMGREPLAAWHRDCRRRGICVAAGNAMVKDMVAQGVCDLGFTDTDDYFEARDQGKPVAMLPVRLEDGATICIPNTVCIPRGAPHLDDARRLADYLLSAEVEEALANEKSRQIPLGPVNEARIPPEVRELRRAAEARTDLAQLGAAPQECLAWLKEQAGGE
jgi:iron(III) transport system substrate-binding protein